MKRKKVMSLALTMVMALSSLAGCGGGTNALEGGGGAAAASTSGTESSDVAEMFDLTPGNMPIVTDSENAPVFHIVRSRDPLQTVNTSELPMSKKLEEDTGIRIEWEEVPTVGLTEKINLMMTGSDLPDAFWDCISNDMISIYMGQDLLIPVNELEEKYMPNLTKIYEEHPEYKALATAPDGNRYGFPYIEEMYGLVRTPGPFLINQDWLDKVGKEMPTTLDEWVDCLRAFKAAGDLNGNGIDDEIPFTLGLASTDMYDSYDVFNRFCMAFGTPTTSGDERADDNMVVIDGKVQFTAADPAYKETAKFFNQLYEEGLIDVNAFSPSPNPRYALYWDQIKGDTALYGCFGTWSPENEIPNADVRAQYAPLPRLEGPNGKIGEVVNNSEMQRAARFVITSACEHPEVLARMVDYIYSPDMSISFNWSPEGYVYHADETGKWVFQFDDNGNIIIPEPWSTISEVSNNTRGTKGPTAIFNSYYDDKVEYDYAAQNLLKYQRVNGKDEWLEEIESMPPVLKTAEEMATISQIQPQIKNIVNSYRMQWILDGDADATWDKYLQELDAAGLPQLMELFQTIYDRYSEQQ